MRDVRGSRWTAVVNRRVQGAMLVIALVGGTVAVSTGPAKAGTSPKSGAATDCSTAAAQGVARQTNTRSSQLAVTCGLTPVANGAPASGPATASPAPAQVGAGDVNTITGTETAPHVTQSEDQVWANGSTVVVAYNDSATAPGNYSGLSRSTDSGHTFTRLNPSPFATGHGTNFGDPIIVFNKKLATWFGGDLADGCGGQGIGLWTSPDALTWTVGTCAVTESQGDRQSMTVDNTPTSPFYGRMYISWNDFNIASGALFVTHSDDGITWSPLQVTTTFIRDVQIGVTSAGNLLLMAMNEGGGAFNPRQNLVYRSSDGGLTFASAIAMGGTFPAPGDVVNGYFAVVNPIWRFMGWGDLATGANNVVIYSYTVHGTGADGGDIFIVRSTDDGLTWGAPLRVDGDGNGGEQWMTSTAGGGKNFLVSWYDRRNAKGSFSYERWGITSIDGGLTWSSPQRISDVLIPQPAQPDPNVQAQYAGDYMRDFYDPVSNVFYDAWTDGRVAVAGVQQQDVFLDRVTPTGPASDYNVQLDGTTVPVLAGTTDVGNHCDDCTTSVTLPFPVKLYGTSYTKAIASSNGNLQFTGDSTAFANPCLPTNTLGTSILPYFDDLATDRPGEGIFTGVIGTAPARQFIIEWRAHLFSNNAAVNFEVIFNESSSTFRTVYGALADSGTSATVGVQRGGTGGATQIGCNAGTLTAGLRHEYLVPTAPSGTGGAHLLIAYADGGGAGARGSAGATGSPSASGPAPAPATLATGIRTQLLSQPGVASVDVFDTQLSTPSLGLLAGYQEVIVITNNAAFDPVALGDVLADYEQLKQGVVVAGQFAFDSRGSWQVLGRWLTGGYSPYAPTTTTAFSAATLGTFTASNPVMTGVSALNGFFRHVITLASGGISVAKWSDGQEAVALRYNNASSPTNGRRAVGINAYFGDNPANFSGDYAKIMVNAVHWLSPFVDQVAPTGVVMTQPSVPFQTSSNVTATWTGNDPGSGIKSYDLEARTAPFTGGFGAYAPILTGTTLTTVSYAGTPGTTLCFHVRSTDNAGNVSAFSSDKCTAVPLDDPSLTRAGTWTTASGAQFFGGSASDSTTQNSSLTTASPAQAHRIAVLASTCPTCGSMQVFYGGVLKGTFSLVAAAADKQYFVVPTFVGTPAGSVQVVVSSSSGDVKIDGIAINRT